MKEHKPIKRKKLSTDNNIKAKNSKAKKQSSKEDSRNEKLPKGMR